MKISLQLKYLAVIPPVASICFCYLAWRWFKSRAWIAMHNLLESNNKIPEKLMALQDSVTKNSTLMLLSCIAVMSSWFAFAPDSILNIYTYMIGTWIYTAIDTILHLNVHKF
jgi:uncharacterized YccA/Bax inhibitor family protein